MASGKITNKTTLSGSISSGNNLTSGTISGGSGTTDHSRLINRANEDQHPIEAITGLRSELDSKLNSTTALPLIDEALQGKAKGLYFDALKELARKSYWYLTAEIDPKTGLGTKNSIISGPYDLGMGGGSGGGGGGGLTTVSIKTIDWPTTIVLGNPVSLSVEWSSVIGEEKEPTGNGSLYLSVNGTQVAVKPNQSQGIVTFENVDLKLGTNSIEIKVIDAYGTTRPVVNSITAVELVITDTGLFNDGTPWPGEVQYRFKALGNFSKDIYFIVDGNTETPYQILKNITSSGTLLDCTIKGLRHGMHTLEVYYVTNLNGEIVTSNRLYHELIVYEKNNSTPIITSSFAKSSTQEQYISFNIPYYVYNDVLTQPRVYYYLEYQGVRTELETFAGGILADRSLQKLPYRFDICHLDEKGNEITELNKYSLIIKCGITEKKFDITVTKSRINIVPVATALALHLDAQGRSNSEINRDTWIDKASGVSCELTGFNWASNGWMSNLATSESFLRLNAGAKVVVPYKILGGIPQNGGKTIELDFAARDIRDYDTPILTCRNAQTRKFYDVSTTFVDSDIRAKNFTVTLDQTTFAAAYPNAGTYIFEYQADDSWKLTSGETVDLSSCGITLTEHEEDKEGEYPDKWKLVGDLIVISVVEEAIGFYVTPQKVAIRSLQSRLSVQFKEDEHVRISIVIEDGSTSNTTHILWIYVNGIASCAIQYPLEGENFAHENFMYLGSTIETTAEDGSKVPVNNATLDIYNIRVYNQALTGRQIVDNWIADTQNPGLKASRYAKNAIYDEWSGKITPESIEALGNLPYVIWDIDTLPQFKGDKRLGNVVYKDPLGKERSFKSGDATYNVQGTSSAGYPVKNIRIKHKQAKAEEFPNCDFWWEDGYEDEDGETIKKFPITVDGIGVDYFTYKVDYASSEGANNVELVRLYNDLSKELGILTPPQRQDSKVRVGIDGFPIVAFHEDATGTRTFCTKANFNNDKDNEDVYGFANGDESWEITNNSFRTTKFKAGVNIVDKSSSDYYSKAFEARFPEDNSDLSKLKAMTDWVASTDPEQCTNKTLMEILGEASVTFHYTDKALGEDNSYKDVEKEETFDTDSREYRITKFKAELKDWFDVDSTLFYYLYTELFLMIDSRAKNAFPTYFKSRQADDGGDRWFWIPYDMDTALGINNMGELVFDYSLEDHGEYGKYAGGKVYNGQESVMWNNVREGFYGQLSAMYARMRSSLLNFAEINARFEDHQDKWPEAIYNEDAIIKYVNPLRPKAEGGLGENYLSMLQGSKAQQRKWWLYNRLRYIDSKYNAADAKNDYVQFRAYAGGAGTTKPSISVIPYTDIYAAVSYSNGELKTARAPRNLVTVVPTSFTSEDDSNEQETYIYSASQLKEIGDLSPFYAKTVKAAAAIKLQKLIIGNSSPDYKNENLRQLELGENILLKVLDARNCVNLGKNDEQNATPIVDVSKCTNIEELYFTGTQIKGIQLPDGGTIKKLLLPGTMQSLIIRNQPIIETLQLDRMVDPKTNKQYLELENLWLENVPFDKISAKELLELMINKPAENIGASYSEEFGKYQRGVCLRGIAEQMESITDIHNFISLLDNFFGLSIINSLIVPDLTSKAIVNGSITLSKPVAYADLVEICDWDDEEQAWRLKDYRDTLIKPSTIVCTVTFDKANGEAAPFEDRNINQGSLLEDLPQTPTKPAIQKYSYEFSRWVTEDGSLWDSTLPIMRNMTLTAEYTSHIRQYTVTYKTNSNIITVEPTAVTVDYGSTLITPTVFGIPEDDTVIFRGWYDEENNPNTPWIFDELETQNPSATKVQDNVTLTAHWTDKGHPYVEILPKTYNTFSYAASDNLGITKWAVVKDSTESPSEWTITESTTSLTGIYEIDAAGDYRFWISDANGNTAFQDITAYEINVTVLEADGRVPPHKYFFIEGDTKIETTFALSSTILQFTVEPDDYYKNVRFEINVPLADSLDTFIVSQAIDITISSDPKTYTVTFETGRESDGVKVSSQVVTYLHRAEKPLAIYHAGYIINAWYTDKTLTTPWNFETDVIEGNISLYAEWWEYRTPTRVKIQIPHSFEEWEDAPLESSTNYESIKAAYNPYKISVNYTQNRAHDVRVVFGDGTGEYTTEGITYATTIEHIYTEPGEYIVEIYGTPRGYSLGGSFTQQAVDPACCITDIDFAWDLPTTREYAFKGASIEELKLTPYMTTIATAAFAVCRKLKTINIPASIYKLGSQSFENCSGLVGNIVIPKTVSEVGNNVFANCSNLDQIIFENDGKLREIGSQFANNSGIKSLIIPSYIQHIKTEAFGNCGKLEKVVLLNPNLTMGERVFNSTVRLNSAGPIGYGLGYAPGDNPAFDIEYAWETKIPDYAFSAGTNFRQSYLYEVTLPDTLTEIGYAAFRGAGIKQLNFPANAPLKVIDDEAFYFTALLELDVPATVTSVGSKAFGFNASLNTVFLRFGGSVKRALAPTDGWFFGCNADLIPRIPTALIQDFSYLVEQYGEYWNVYGYNQDTTESFKLFYTGI